MSKYGDERMHMEDWQDQLQERAKAVGPQQAMREMLKVVHDFTDMYWTEKEESQPCQHPHPDLVEWKDISGRRVKCVACQRELTFNEILTVESRYRGR